MSAKSTVRMAQPELSRSFCHQPKSKVERLIQAEGDICICNRCVALCFDVLSKEGVDMSGWRRPTPPTEED
jgi:ATP-dependent protease Clp ATPase subunit